MPPQNQEQQQQRQPQQQPASSSSLSDSQDTSNQHQRQQQSSQHRNPRQQQQQQQQVITQTIDLFVLDHPVHGPIPAMPPPTANSGAQVAGPTLYVHFDGQTLHLSDTPNTELQIEMANRSEHQQQQPTAEAQQQGYNLRPRTARNHPELEQMIRAMFENRFNRPAAERTTNRHRRGDVGRQMADGLVGLLVDILMIGGMMPGGPHLQGQPPASTEAKENLHRLATITKHQLNQCPKCLVCLEEFPADETLLPTEGDDCVRQMPCKHLFHEACIFQWLQNSNQCPTCRYEIMTENAEYNSSIKERMAQRDAEILLEEERLLKAEQKPAALNENTAAASAPDCQLAVEVGNNKQTESLQNDPMQSAPVSASNRKRSRVAEPLSLPAADAKRPRNRRNNPSTSSSSSLSSITDSNTAQQPSSQQQQHITNPCRYPLRNRRS